MTNLINNDVSRCNNHRCPKRNDCARYRQLELDFVAYRDNAKLPQRTIIASEVLSSVPVTRFDAENCGHFIDIKEIWNNRLLAQFTQ